MSRPLEGLRVLDLSHLVAGPFCTMLLADAGADVIKIEPPAGDISRRRIPRYSNAAGAEVSGYFLAVNRGKRSVVLDLKTAVGRELLEQLLTSADVFVENFRPGVLGRLGIDIEALCRDHPRLVASSITAFGRRNVPAALEAVPGLAIVAEAMSGITSRAKDDHDEPVWCGFPLGDFSAGLTAYSAIVTALLERERTGHGRFLDISMAEAMLAFNTVTLACDEMTARDPEARSVQTVPYGVFRAKDGHVAIGVNSDVFWRRLCFALDRPELAADDTLADQTGRAEHSARVIEIVTAWTSTLTRDQIAEVLQREGVPVSPVNETSDVLTSELFRNRVSLTQVDDGIGGTTWLPGSAQGLELPATRIPRLGEHTEDVLREVLNFDAARLHELGERGAFGHA